MEWNWFFSTIAQSTAAITGIFAAFIITKIVGSQAEYRKKCARIRELIAIAEKFQDKLKNQYFTWYNERTDFSAMKQVRELIWGDNPIRSAEEYYDEAEFSVYSESSETICKIEAILEEINAAGNQDRSTRTHEFNTLPTSTDSMQFQLDFTAKLRDNLRKERESIEEISLEVRHHTRTVEIFLKEIIGNPESSQLIKWAILGVLILFYTGVIFRPPDLGEFELGQIQIFCYSSGAIIS